MGKEGIRGMAHHRGEKDASPRGYSEMAEWKPKLGVLRKGERVRGLSWRVFASSLAMGRRLRDDCRGVGRGYSGLTCR